MKIILAFHIIAMVAWFAGLFYLPRLFVYHASASDQIGQERFKVMERKLYYAIMTPAAIVTTALGIILLSEKWGWYLAQPWMIAKLTLVLLLWVYHFYCGHLEIVFKHDQNTFSHRFYRFFNEIPTLLLIAIVLLAFLH